MDSTERTPQILSVSETGFVRERADLRLSVMLELTAQSPHHTTSGSTIHTLFYISGSQPGAILPPTPGHLDCGGGVLLVTATWWGAWCC